MLDLKKINTDKTTALRDNYPVFTYESFKYEVINGNLVISFIFKIAPDIEFNPTLQIEEIADKLDKINKSVLENFIFHLGLVEMLSYWKATCSPRIEIKAGSLNEKQINWWENLLKNGLGEFFYQNKIDFTKKDFVKIENKSEEIYPKDNLKHSNRYLVLNSGGRDSAVTLEIFKELKKEIAVLMLNPTQAALDVYEISGFNSKILIKREIDKNLLDLNQKGYLNGHTPFSAYLAFLSLMCAYIYDYSFTVSSNERSSNEENVEFLGRKINHQYTKSFEFEKLFRDYSKETLSVNITYFSTLRPLYELQISKVFSVQPKYFGVFKSCNVGQKTNTWCGNCPKCLSIYISLYPFLTDEEMLKIFKADLYENENLKDLLLHITGKLSPKPFECVGTYNEVLEGLKLSIEKFGGQQLPPLLLYAKNNILKNDQKFNLQDWENENFLDEEFSSLLQGKIGK